MNTLERMALTHAAAWIAYQRTPQAAIDAANDRAARIVADVKSGHTPQCTFTKCAAHCPRK